MKIVKSKLPFIIFIILTGIFFYKFFLFGYIPFPGDLLISEYNPWKSFSYLGYNPGSYPNKGQYFDVIRQIYPWKTLSITSVQKGEMPFWNPYNFSGTPLLANFQSAVFYPLNIVYFLIPQIYAWTVLIYLQPVLSGLFTYFFAREKGISQIGSYFSGVSFAFCSFLTVWLQYNTIDQVILWLPLQLLSTERLLAKRSVLWMILFVLSMVAEQFGGHPQVFIYSFMFSLIYLGFRVLTYTSSLDTGKILLFFSSLYILSLGVGSIQNVPGFALILQSARSSHAYTDIVSKILIQPWQLIMLLVPDIFGNPATRNYWLTDTYIGKVTSVGIIPLMFSLLTITQMKKIDIRFFWVMSLIILLITTRNPFTEFLYLYQIPFFSSSSPTLCIFIFCFSLSILCGYGVDMFRKANFTIHQFLLLISPIIAAFTLLFILTLFESKLGLFAGKDHVLIAIHNIVYGFVLFVITVIFLFLGIKKRKYLLPILIILLVIQIGDSFRSFEKFNPFVPKLFIYPKNDIFTYLQKNAGIDRIWSFGSAQLEANVQTVFHLFSPEGYDPLYPKYYGAFVQSSQHGEIITTFTDQTRSDATIAPAQAINLMTNASRKKVLNLLGVKYIIDNNANGSTENTFPPQEFKNIYSMNQWHIYRNLQALPRAFLVSQYSQFTSPNDFSKQFFTDSFKPNETVLLEQKLPIKLTATSKKVIVTQYTPNEIHLASSTNGTALLFLSDTYYPDWQATIDGNTTAIYRADYAFRAILVPKGNHRVIFTFSSSSFKIGSIISILSMLALIAWLFYIHLGNLEKAYAKK